METKPIRTLTADEIDVRVAQTSNYGGVVKVTLLLYKDARVDMKLLDELYGPMGWKRTHQLIGDRLYCTIEVRDPATGEWIAKQDVGTESNTEPEKGQASDAFKRAGFNWGLGRELYTAPRVVVTLNEKEYKDQGGRIQVWQTFRVAQIGYDDLRNINDLVIVDRDGIERFRSGLSKGRTATTKKATAPATAPTKTEYWAIVRAYGDGKPTKAGGDYRQAFIDKYNPTAEQLDRFDLDVQDYRAAKQDGSIQ